MWSYFVDEIICTIFTSGFQTDRPKQTVLSQGLHSLPAIQQYLKHFKGTTVLSTSFRKIFFTWHIILNENIFFGVTISYQKPLVFSVSVFCSQICTLKLNLQPKIGLTYAISMVK